MVRITAVFSAGVILCIYRPELFSVQLVTVVLLVFLTIYFIIWLVLNRSSSIKLATGVVGLIAVFWAGYLTVLLRNEERNEDHILYIKQEIVAYKIKLITPGEEKQKSFKRLGTVLGVKTKTGWQQASGKVNLYWPKSEPVMDFDYGDILLIKGSPRELESAYNPYEFDFKAYLKFKNVFHQHFVRGGEWKRIEKSRDNGFLFYAHRARNWSVSAIKNNISSSREQGLMSALVLGVVDGLDTDLLNAYAASGAMHVLAVSGLHVSIIYGILLFFFKPLGKSVSAQWLIAILSLVLLWGYAFITGLSPSVLRAVTMFSFVAIAKPVGRSTNFYNTLAASAFCLLLYDPYLIMSVGFQLSYLAVLGIVYLQRPIYNLWEAKSWFMNWAWQLSCVSIAAQIATFALGFLYFHQFPVYFLVANLFIIPGSFVVLVGGILLLLISPLTFIASWLGMGLEWFVRILNEGIFLVEKLPYCLISDVYISTTQCYLLFGLLIVALLLVQFRKFQLILMMTGIVILFSHLSWVHLNTEIKKSRWTVYRIQGHSAMEWSDNGSSRFAGDSSLLKDNRNIRFHLFSNRLVNGVRNIESAENFASTRAGLQILNYKGKRFLWIKSSAFKVPERLHVDYTIVSNNSLKSLKSFSGHVFFKQLIIDGSNSSWNAERLEMEGKELGMAVYSVLRKGAFVVEL
ncbi:ComEC/Rec2 family competence protein [soil metagenome]